MAESIKDTGKIIGAREVVVKAMTAVLQKSHDAKEKERSETKEKKEAALIAAEVNKTLTIGQLTNTKKGKYLGGAFANGLEDSEKRAAAEAIARASLKRLKE